MYTCVQDFVMVVFMVCWVMVCASSFYIQNVHFYDMQEHMDPDCNFKVHVWWLFFKFANKLQEKKWLVSDIWYFINLILYDEFVAPTQTHSNSCTLSLISRTSSSLRTPCLLFIEHHLWYAHLIFYL